MKIGFIGSGFIAHFQAVAIKQVRGLEIAGLTRRSNSEATAKFCRDNGLGEAKIYDSIAAMADHVDVIAIYAPNYARIEVMEEIVAAVKAGTKLKGVVVEKPLGRNMKEAHRLVELAREAKLHTAYFENQIFMKSIQTQREQLVGVTKSMGPLTLARSAEEHAGPHEPWFWDPTRQGGGVLADMGCHSIAVGRYVLTPPDKDLLFLQPQKVTADVGLLKWGQPQWREKLLKDRGVDYGKTPAEDFATGMITYRNPETGQLVKAQFTNSWMFEKQGLRLFMDGVGPGYAFEVNTLVSPLNVFIGDEAAEAIADQESALEKSTSSRGLLAVQYNEADLYGYTDENVDMLEAFTAGRDAMLSWEYGLEVQRLVMASYMSAERGETIDLTDPNVIAELDTYVPLIQQGKGRDQLM
ncbi:MAG: Gfo/Idh/MocA family oxidoreductase [Betaproteobacteria bacterium]|nr:MAG: Gfo/Idh/MocA family oxidoreductase [Betaproteobacteria bacterium]